jgi:hypothetical protein
VALPLLINDPEHAPRHAPSLRGITPLRLACFAAACIALAARPALANGVPDVMEGLRRLWNTTQWFFVFGLPLFVLVIKCDLWTARASPVGRTAAFAAAVLGGSAVLATMPFCFLPWDLKGLWQWQLGYLMRGLLLGSLMAAILHFARRETEALHEMYRTRIARIEAERRRSSSRLHALNAQIEPHFLFNCLASVKRLYGSDPGTGRAMLRNLLTYVRTATARAGAPQARLGDEIALAKAFLDLFQVRMGARLRVKVDVPAHLEDAVVPSLAIGTLVENAIKHGIAPRATGGTVDICARLADRQLVVDVCDDGVGFRACSGPGIGLANIRAQIRESFHGDGALELRANPQGGVTASLMVPCRLP